MKGGVRGRRPWIVGEAGQVVVLTGRAAWRGLVGIYRGDDLTYAASVAYYALLSLFPFCLLMLAVIGNATADEANRQGVVNFILTYFPARFEFLTHQLDTFRRTRLQLSIGGSIGVVWAAMGVFSAITSAVNHAWGVEQQRSYLRHKLFSFLMLAASGVLLLGVLLILSAVQLAEASWFAFAAERLPVLRVLSGLALRYATTAMLILIVGLIFYFVPNAPVRVGDIWVGALATGLLLKGGLVAFSWYVRDMSRFTEINGSIATVIVFLVWVYMSAVILLYGVEMTAAYARLGRQRSAETPAAPRAGG